MKNKILYFVLVSLVVVGIATYYYIYSSDLSVITIDDLSNISAFDGNLPITSKESAISFAVNVPGILSTLESASERYESNSISVRWHASASLDTSAEIGVWTVIIKTVGVLPEFSCTLSFTSTGALENGIPKCIYDK
ncbi:MAG: hypothetical protein R3B92_00510 [Patescibacteria group bacterium]|uniref:Uncharacterized protein n=1 Tax=candidate division WWE3 bacterium TaxID=2053526 RepID=A0A955EBP3_UNCKA|nr:hypothetical protein [candidate division WWE3 bacterium]